mmetsp:Transcript_17177/g.54939  ORF Transcript_17177/g.54939 Transcript_17177/m.54939 type:complete len:186 (+) Transcript_17177:1732-2289(+)
MRLRSGDRVGGGGNGTVFVTVGTTKFDALIMALDCDAFVEILSVMGYTSLLLQIGTGEYEPHNVFGREGEATKHRTGVTLEYFRLRPSLAQLVESASLVISHAGAGSIFESLKARRALLVVVNDRLMDNHQSELAEHLSSLGHLACCNPGGVLEAVGGLDAAALVPYDPGDAKEIAADVDRLMGF